MSLALMQANLRKLQSLLRSDPQYLIDRTFKAQASFVDDQSTYIAALCTRRAGKSMAVAIKLIKEAMSLPGCNVLYLALTRDSARSILWKDCIKAIDSKYQFGMKFNETLLEAKLSNGSVIKLSGADANAKEMEKILGSKFRFIAIDEAGSFNQDMRVLVYEMLKPCTIDYNGSIALIGTPHFRTNGLFFDVTEGQEPGWSVHKWTTFDNPYMEENFSKEIEEIKRLRPLYMSTPAFKRMYLGQWFIDLSKLVYKYQEDLNDLEAIEENSETWSYVLGVDLGYSPDPSAFVLGCYRDHDPNLYIVSTYSQTEMIISAVAEKIKDYLRAYPRIRIVIDASNKQAVEEMRQRWGLPIQAAEKQGKAAFIELMNSSMLQGFIKVVGKENEAIKEEWRNLVWLDKDTKREEDPSCSNHLADAALYMWREAYNYLSKPKERSVDIYGEESIHEYWKKQEEQLGSQQSTEQRLGW